MEENNLKMMSVNYNQSSGGFEYHDIKGDTVNANYLHVDDYDWYKRSWVPYYPSTYTYTITEDKYKKAMNIAKMLLARKLLMSYIVSDFVKLVEDIAAEL